MAKYLDENGLSYLWAKLKAKLETKVDKVEGKQLSTNDFTTAEKTKLANIAENANNYVHPETHSASMITETDSVKMMTAAERTKLAGIAENANAYELPLATDAVAGGVKVGTNLSINDAGVLSATDTGATVTTVSGEGNAVTGATYDAATRTITLTKGATYLTQNDVADQLAEIHKAEIYRYTGATTDVATAVASFTDVTFGAGDVIVITDEDGISAAYQYDENNGIEGAAKWEALAGKVNAENVVFTKNITCAGNYTGVGNITKSSTGTATLSSDGKSVFEVFQQVFTKVLQPTVTNPTATISLTGAGNKEVGTDFTPAYAITFNKGAYTYDASTGVTASTYAVADSNDDTATAQSGAIGAKFTVLDTTNYTVHATVTYTEGNVAKDNIGGNSAPEKKIAAGTCNTGNSAAVKGYRPYFYGVLATTTADAPLTSTIIHGLTNGGIYNGGKTLNLKANAVSGAKRVVIATPAINTTATNARGGLTKVLMPSAMNADATAAFVRVTGGVQVNDASGVNPANYNVWVYEPASIDSSETYTVTLA